MAATRLIALHINKGKTIAQCLRDRTDYAQNPEKTEKGELVSGYECDPMTADEEFLLAKRQYLHITGRRQQNDVIAYQIRQSFKPGEITPEEANRVGYELGMRFTKGKHAFLVATHTDRAHIHNHIVFNSTSLDCKRKFRDFHNSGLALQKVSDIICMEHGLSIIEKKPYKEHAFNDMIPKIKAADLIVFASPLYFWTLSSRIKAFIERFYCIAEEDLNPPLGRYEKYPVKDCALLMTSADNYFWTFEQAVSYYKFALVNYIGFHDKGMLLAGGCGDTNGKPQIDRTPHLKSAYEFGKNIYCPDTASV